MKLFNREITVDETIGFCKTIEKISDTCSGCLVISAANSLVSEIERLQQQNEWVSVGDRLPEIMQDDCSDDVLIAVKYATDLDGETPTICCGYLLDGNWWSFSEHDCREIGRKPFEGDTVTHWKPLSKPPRGDKQ